MGQLNLLTDKVFHHLRGVMRSWCNAQQFVSPGDRWVVDCLNVDVVTTHHEVTHFSVFLCIRNLKMTDVTTISRVNQLKTSLTQNAISVDYY